MNPPTADRLLKWLLRAIGGVELCAIPFIIMPMAWMDVIHDRGLGLGRLPREPVVEYLARSLSALYAAHGAVVFFLSFDISRYRPVIRFLGVLHLLFGSVVLVIDLVAGWPWFWTAFEGPGILLGGVLILYLARAGFASDVK